MAFQQKMTELLASVQLALNNPKSASLPEDYIKGLKKLEQQLIPAIEITQKDKNGGDSNLLKLKVYVSFNGQAKENVIIAIVKGPKTRPEIADEKTDVTGFVEFKNLQPGYYEINAWDSVSNTYFGAAKIDLKPGGIAQINLSKKEEKKEKTEVKDNPQFKPNPIDKLPDPINTIDPIPSEKPTDKPAVKDKKEDLSWIPNATLEIEIHSFKVQKSLGYYRLDKIEIVGSLEPADINSFKHYITVSTKLEDLKSFHIAWGKKFNPAYVVGGLSLGEPVFEVGTKGKIGAKVLQWETEMGDIGTDFNLIGWDSKEEAPDDMVAVLQTELSYTTPGKEWEIGGITFKGKLKITASFSLDKAKALTKILEIGGEKLVERLVVAGAESAASSAIPMVSISALEIAAIAAPIAWIAACGYALYTIHKFNKDLWDLRTAPGKVADAYAAGFGAGLHGGEDTSNDVSQLGTKAGQKMRGEYLSAYMKAPAVVQWLKENNDDKKTLTAEFNKKFELMIPKLVRAAWSSAMADAKNKKFKEFLDEHGYEGTTLVAWGEFLTEYPTVSRWGDTSYVSSEVWAFVAKKYAGREFSYKDKKYNLPSKQADMFAILNIDEAAQKADQEDLFKIEKAFAAWLKTIEAADKYTSVTSILTSWTTPDGIVEARATFNSETHHKTTEKDLSPASIFTMLYAEIDRRKNAEKNAEAEKKQKQLDKIAKLKKDDKANIAQVDYGDKAKGIHAKAQGMQEKLGKKIQVNTIPRVVVAARSLHNKGNEVFGQAYTLWQKSMKESDLEKRVNLQSEAIGLYEGAIIHYETGLDCYDNPPPIK